MSEKFEISVDSNELKDLVGKLMIKKIEEHLIKHEFQIDKALDKAIGRLDVQYNRDSDLENKLHWAVQDALDKAFMNVVEEIGLQEKIKPVILEILSKKDVVEKIAEQKVFRYFNI